MSRVTHLTVPRTGKLYYGWVMMTLAMLLLAATSAGQTFGISPFNAELRESLKLSHSQLASAYMLGTIVGAIPIFWFATAVIWPCAAAITTQNSMCAMRRSLPMLRTASVATVR